MSYAFEVTHEDIFVILHSHHVQMDDDMINSILDSLDDDLITKAVLSVDIDGDDDEVLHKQTEVAYDAIALQLLNSGYITEDQIRKYGNPDLLNMYSQNNTMKF